MIQVSEPELQAALDYLAADPQSSFARDPAPWSRQRLLEFIEESLPKKPRAGECFQISFGLYGLIRYVGTDLAGGDKFDGLQVWLLTRPGHTDLQAMVPLNGGSRS